MSSSYGYAKVFDTLLDSSIWQEDHPTVRLWITMMLMANRDGEVFAAVPGLAQRARITIEECERALAKFKEPDKYSSSPEYEGRRIEAIPRGWKLLNYLYYREKMDAEDVKIKAAKRQADKRRRDAEKAAAKALKKGKPLPGEQGFVNGVESGETEAELNRRIDEAL